MTRPQLSPIPASFTDAELVGALGTSMQSVGMRRVGRRSVGMQRVGMLGIIIGREIIISHGAAVRVSRR